MENMKTEEAIFLSNQNFLNHDESTEYMVNRANQIRNDSNPSIDAKEAFDLYQQSLLTFEEYTNYAIKRSNAIRAINEKNKPKSAASDIEPSFPMR